MSYITTTWVAGDTVTAEKLNKIETGINNIPGGNRIFWVNKTNTGLDKTYNQIATAFLGNKVVMLNNNNVYYNRLSSIRIDSTQNLPYIVNFWDDDYDGYAASDPDANMNFISSNSEPLPAN